MEEFLTARAEDAVTAHQDGTYLDVVVANVWVVLLSRPPNSLVLPGIVPLFLFGLAVGCAGIVQNLPAHRDRRPDRRCAHHRRGVAGGRRGVGWPARRLARCGSVASTSGPSKRVWRAWTYRSWPA
jgi:hypothetical protein